MWGTDSQHIQIRLDCNLRQSLGHFQGHSRQQSPLPEQARLQPLVRVPPQHLVSDKQLGRQPDQ